MKKILLALAAMAFVRPISTDAQTLCPGSGFNTPDVFWFNTVCSTTVGLYISDINTAMIDFPASVQPKMQQGSLIACIWAGNGGTTAGGVAFADKNTGYTISLPYCSSSDYIVGIPDIILGNDPSNPFNGFLAAAAFYNRVTLLPQINYYRILYTSATTFTVSMYASSSFLPPTSGDWEGNTVHIDVIADANNTAITGYPWCKEFVVTWDDRNGCWAHKAALPAPPGIITASLPTIFLPGSGGPTLPYQPDVAAIQRLNASGGIEQIGIFALNEDTKIICQEYNWSTGVMTLINSHPSTWGPYTAMLPRIDAPDDFNINDPTTPNLCYYKIVTEIGSAGMATSYLYDNNSPVGVSGFDDGAAIYGTTDINSPTIAYGGNSGTQYQVSHFVQEYSGGIGTPTIYMEPTNWMYPAAANVPDFYGANQWFYQVNMNTPVFANGKTLNAISTPCNNPGGGTLCAWADHDPSVPWSYVQYKITSYGGTWGYTFRPGHESPLTNAGEWRMYPNPTNGVLTIENGYDGNYEIRDMLGRIVLRGNLIKGSQQVDVSSLSSGKYFITCSSYGQVKNNSSFVKN